MDAHEEYAYICIACHERLLSSTHNQWIRVGKRHLMPRTGISIREHGRLLLEEDSVVGKQELASCELQRLQCGNCKSHIGLRCKDAPISKKRLIGRVFVRQAAVEVHALTTPPGSDSSSVKRVVRRVQFDVEQQSHLVSPNVLVKSPVGSAVDSASQDSDLSGQQKTLQPEQIHAILEKQASLIAEVKALRQVAARNQQVLRSQLDQVSATNSSEYEHQNNRGDALRVTTSTEHSGSGTDGTTQARRPKRSKPQEESMLPDTDVEMANNDPPSRPVEHTGTPVAAEMSYDTQLLVAPLEPLPERHSDSDYEPTQPLIDQPLHQPLTRNLTRDEGNRRGARHASFDLRRNTLEDLHKSQDISKPSAGLSRRGGALRRGFSGGRVKPSANSPKRKVQELNTPPLRDKNGNLITSTGKIDGRSLRYKNAQSAGYQSSPLAAPYSLDGTTSSGSNTSARGNGASNDDPAASSTALMTRTVTSSSGDGVAKTHQEIMKYVKKGMKAQMAKSRLERGYARLPKPS